MKLKHHFLLAVITTLLFNCQSTKRERVTKNIISHENVTIICDPSQGNNLFSSWGVFPKQQESIRRIFMEVTLGHPDSIDIAHWDYMDPIRINRVGGLKGDTLNLEIGKMLTPYGSNFKKDWDWRWQIDVTDFSSILRDSVEITYNHTGYEGANVGWKLKIDFKFEMGDPVAQPLGFHKLYDDGFSYGNPEKPITKSLSPKEIKMKEDADFARIRVLHTGHGMDKPKGCSEFCSRWREILVDGKTIDHRDMWKECGDNNLYPQGGTWIFDRAYWCPGDLQSPDIIDFPITKPTHTLDFEMEPYVAEENIQAYESISAMVFEYNKPTKSNDVSLEQILVPNDAPELNRLNPSVIEPKIILKNLGSENLKEVQIKYGTEGFEEKTFLWKGNLAFYEEAYITLPGIIDFKFGENTFNVALEDPNGKSDEWISDNMKSTNFNSPKEIPKNVVVTYQTNNNPEENTVRIINADNKIFYEKHPSNTKKDTVYKDTIKLDIGPYRMSLEDTEHNGLEFWFMPKQGFGYLQISDLEGRVLHRFESDCGVGEQLDFIVKDNPTIDNNVEQSLVKLYPRRIRETTQLLVQLVAESNGEIHILKDGDIQEKIPFSNIKEKTFEIDLSSYEDGRYVIELFVNGDSKLKQRISKQNSRN